MLLRCGNAILHSLGRIELKLSITEIVERAEAELSVTLLGIDPVHIDQVRILAFNRAGLKSLRKRFRRQTVVGR